MRRAIRIGCVTALGLLAVAWVYVGSISDRLAGNRTMISETPVCDDASICERFREFFIADAHSDTLLHRAPNVATRKGHSDIYRLAEGGVDLQILAMASVAPTLENRDNKVCGNRESGDRLTKLFIAKEPLRPATWMSPMARVRRMIGRFEGALADGSAGKVTLHKIESKSDLAAAQAAGPSGSGRVGAVLAIEGAYWAASDEAGIRRQIDELEKAGIRMIGLTHRSSNHLAGSNEDCTDRHGLTALGHFMASEIWQRNMVLDLAHASSKTIADVAELAGIGSGRPVVVSHTGIRSACSHDRNLTDEDVRNIARADGLIAIGFWSVVNCFEGSFSAAEARRAIARSFGVAHGILSAPDFVAEMGPGFDATDHLALGSDFDGATLVPADASAMPWYLEGIAQFESDGQRPFDFAAIEKIAGANLFGLLERTLKPN